MDQVLLQGRRLFVTLYTLLSIGGYRYIVSPQITWINHWWENRSSIVMFAAVNTSITTLSEMGSRLITVSVTHQKDQGFFITDERGERHIHRQSVINIFMTLVASLLGGPVYFLVTRRKRFMFFIAFGAFNSLLSQSLSFILRGEAVRWMSKRLLFDLAYNASIKYHMFEFMRPVLLRYRGHIGKVWIIRVTQDFLTTLARVLVLGLLGLKG